MKAIPCHVKLFKTLGAMKPILSPALGIINTRYTRHRLDYFFPFIFVILAHCLVCFPVILKKKHITNYISYFENGGCIKF